MFEVDLKISFVYAGYGEDVDTADSASYDTVSILTLPAFHWVSAPYTPNSTRTGHSCNAVGGSQILTIGGIDPYIQEDDGSTDDQFNSSDPHTQGLAIFDMTKLAWLDQYTAGTPPYEQSSAVKQVYADPNQ